MTQWYRLALKEIIQEIRKLNATDKELFANYLASFPSKSVFKEVSERKHKGGYTCTHVIHDDATMSKSCLFSVDAMYDKLTLSEFTNWCGLIYSIEG